MLADKEPYKRLKEISHRIGKPIKVKVSVNFYYLRSCPAVGGANAGVIADGDWDWGEVEAVVDLPIVSLEKSVGD